MVDPIVGLRLYDQSVDLYPVSYVLLITTATGEDASCHTSPSRSVYICYTRGPASKAICDLQIVTVDCYRKHCEDRYKDYEFIEGSAASGPGVTSASLVFIVKRCTETNMEMAITDVCIVNVSSGEPVPYNYTVSTSWKDTRLFHRGEKLVCTKYMWQVDEKKPSYPLEEVVDDRDGLPSFTEDSYIPQPPKYRSKSHHSHDGHHSSYFVARAMDAMEDSNWSLAMMYLSASLEYDPNNAFLLLQRAIISNAFRKKINMQQNDLTIAFNLEPNWVPLAYYRGEIHEKLSIVSKDLNTAEMHTAVTCYKKCVALDPLNTFKETHQAKKRLEHLRGTLLEMYTKRGQKALSSCMHQTSVTEFTFALDHCVLKTQRAELLKLRGDSYMHMLQYEKALDDFTTAFDLVKQLDVLVKKSVALRHMGRTEESEEMLMWVRRYRERESKASGSKESRFGTWRHSIMSRWNRQIQNGVNNSVSNQITVVP